VDGNGAMDFFRLPARDATQFEALLQRAGRSGAAGNPDAQ
jgi:hypothetical protein